MHHEESRYFAELHLSLWYSKCYNTERNSSWEVTEQIWFQEKCAS